MPVFELSNEVIFPPINLAREDGLLAIGGDLTSERLYHAYKNGIFPWYNLDQPVLWWSPNPRFVLFPEKIKVSKSMRSVMRNKGFIVTYNQNFKEVLNNCQKLPRKGQDGTWITPKLKEALFQFHEEGWAHSVEVWQNNQLVGGLYGIAMGNCFFGESMFTTVSNASKVGFISLVEKLNELNFKFTLVPIPISDLKTPDIPVIFIRYFIFARPRPCSTLSTSNPSPSSLIIIDILSFIQISSS